MSLRSALLASIVGLAVACGTDSKKTADESPDAGSGTDSGPGGAGPADVGTDSGNGGTGGDAAASPSRVDTTKGVVLGKVDGKIRAFLGIPFAAPPLGDNRFRPPQPSSAWKEPRDATSPAKVCPQFQVGSTTMLDPASDEDCLTLNVWTPDLAPAKPLPVMVWFHGGAFVFGSGALPYYDGGQLAETGQVVVVTVNYRLGALGFLSHRALAAESSSHATSGNYGLLDQRAALEWVSKEIGAFGGDPKSVTIFGESAGGFSVCAHMMSPGSRGLFHRAISESGVCSAPDFGGVLTLDQSFDKGDAYATAMGCSDPDKAIECLRAKPASDLLQPIEGATELPGGIFFQTSDPKQANQNWFPIADGEVLPTGTPTLAPVPLILGANATEGSLFPRPELFGGVALSSDKEYEAALERTFGAAKSADVLAQYPASNYATPNDAIIDVTGDAFFVCPARRFARQAEKAGSNVYLYSFAHVPALALIPDLGSFHSSELAYVFGHDPGLAATQDSEKPLVAAVQGYWTRFARTGDPNGSSAPEWPGFTTAGDQSISLDLPAPKAETAHKKAVCDFWDGIQ